MKIKFTILLLFILSMLYAQDQSSFINTAHLSNEGRALCVNVAVGKNGTIFLANDIIGLRATTYTGTSFTNTVSIKDGWVFGVVLGSDGIIYASTLSGILVAYNYDNGIFTKIGSIDIGGACYSLGIDSNDKLYFPNWIDGLRAYTFNGSSFSNIANTNDGEYANSVEIGPDGTVFLVDYTEGLFAYSFDGSTFTNIAHVKQNSTQFSLDCRDVAIGPDGTVFLANGRDGLRAYNFDGITFTNTAHVKDGFAAMSVVVNNSGVVILANDGDGLFAYNYDGSSFTTIAQVSDGGYATGLALGQDGTIFVANGSDGLRSYELNIATNIETTDQIPKTTKLNQNYPNPFNPATTLSYELAKSSNVKITIYNSLGKEIKTLVNTYKIAGFYKIVFDGSNISSGIYYYKISADNFVDTKKFVLLK